MKICAIIAARGGSKGVPGKNIRRLLGKPLIAYSIKQAVSCPGIDKVIVTTDSSGIARLARKYGAETPFLRPARLATDSCGKLAVLQHAVMFMRQRMGYFPDLIVDLDPTSPLRNIADIRACIKLARNNACDAVISATPAKKNPYFNMVELCGDKTVRLCKKSGRRQSQRRQDAPSVYEMNASIYVYRTASLLKMKTLWDGKLMMHQMPPERSVDIDRELDFKVVEYLMKEGVK
ncbi:MAG: acylneuraminate cytidylyltransferase family protein [Candidatus Omnitrophica bacterium]|nr:acylneuraminate cytidylyltransferase family protein [Candidatus Omnitrophota bacterium]